MLDERTIDRFESCGCASLELWIELSRMQVLHLGCGRELCYYMPIAPRPTTIQLPATVKTYQEHFFHSITPMFLYIYICMYPHIVFYNYIYIIHLIFSDVHPHSGIRRVGNELHNWWDHGVPGV